MMQSDLSLANFRFDYYYYYNKIKFPCLCKKEKRRFGRNTSLPVISSHPQQEKKKKKN